MSMPYPTRLHWDESRASGVAEHADVRVRLHRRPPVLECLPRLIEIDYAPGAGVAYYQLAHSARADMSAEQTRECMRYLRAVAIAARTAADVGAALLRSEDGD